MGLAHFVPVNEFTTLIGATTMRDADKKMLKAYNAFLQASDDAKQAMLASMFGRTDTTLQIIAMRYLFKNNRGDLLAQLQIVSGDAASVAPRTRPYQSIARILGYQVSGTINAEAITTFKLKEKYLFQLPKSARAKLQL